MKKLLFILLIFSLNVQAQKLPIIGLCWSDIQAYFSCPECTPTPCLSDAFTKANPAYFDPTYAIAGGDWLREFRNYGPPDCAQLATITTVSMVYASISVATAEVNMSSQGTGCTVTEMGMCYGTSANPTIAGSHTATATVAEGAYSFSISGLTNGTTYHYRAYATNAYGTAYGSDQSYTQECTRPGGLYNFVFYTKMGGVEITTEALAIYYQNNPSCPVCEYKNGQAVGFSDPYGIEYPAYDSTSSSTNCDIMADRYYVAYSDGQYYAVYVYNGKLFYVAQ